MTNRMKRNVKKRYRVTNCCTVLGPNETRILKAEKEGTVKIAWKLGSCRGV